MHKFSWCVHGGCVDTIRILLAMLQLMLEVASEKDFLPTFPPRRPLNTRFYPTATNVTYARGGLAVLYCSVEDLGTKTIIWRKQPYHVPITIGEVQFLELDRFYLNHVLHRDEWNLLIKNVQPFDAGVYECQISSKKKTMRRNITLNVIEKGQDGWPNIYISGTRFVEKGAPISLLCNASNTDSPPDAIDWFKDGNKLVHHKRFDLRIHKELSVASNTIISVLNIDHARMTDTGTYVCRTSGLLTTRYKVDVLNAETYNVKREYEAQSGSIRDRRPSGNGHCKNKNPFIVNVISFIVTLAFIQRSR